MNRIIAAAIAAGFASVALADDPDFTSFDANGDGQLAQDEVSAHTDISAEFDTWDENGDGFIDEAEYDAGMAADSDLEPVSDDASEPMWDDRGAEDAAAEDDSASFEDAASDEATSDATLGTEPVDSEVPAEPIGSDPVADDQAEDDAAGSVDE